MTYTEPNDLCDTLVAVIQEHGFELAGGYTLYRNELGCSYTNVDGYRYLMVWYKPQGVSYGYGLLQATATPDEPFKIHEYVHGDWARQLTTR